MKTYKKTLPLKRASQMTMEQAENSLHTGTITQRDFDRFWLAFVWCAPRYSIEYGHKQAAYCRKHGLTATHNRINRVRKALGLDPYYTS